MTKFLIQFQSLQDVKGFVSAVNLLDSDCEIVSGLHRVDAKSLLAVLTLPITNVMTLEIARSDIELPEQMKKYVWQ